MLLRVPSHDVGTLVARQSCVTAVQESVSEWGRASQKRTPVRQTKFHLSFPLWDKIDIVDPITARNALLQHENFPSCYI
jgi:hypothetical protein